MRSRRRLVHLLVCAGAAVAWLAAAAPAYAGWFLPEQRLTTNSSQQMYPDISGARVVYQDNRFGNWDISLYDLTTGTQRRLTTSTAAQRRPSISGTRVVYTDDRSGHSQLYVCNLSTNVHRRLLITTANADTPAIDGTWVVYTGFEDSGYDYDVYAYDLTTDTVRPLTTSGRGMTPAIDGTRVVYSEYDDLGWHVRVRNLITDQVDEVGITGELVRPEIEGTRVLAMDHRTGTRQIYLHDLASGSETQITAGEARPQYFGLQGTKIWYLDYRSPGPWGLYVYDLNTGAEKRVSALASNYPAAAMSGSRLVYEDLRSGNRDIYLRELAYPSISIKAPATIGYNRTAKVSGTLRSASGVPLANRLVTLSTSTNGLLWTAVDEQRTATGGTYTMYTPALTSARYVRVRFAGDLSYLGATGRRLRIKPQVYLSTPRTPDGAAYKATFTAYGYLKPHHRAGISPLVLQFYRLEAFPYGRSQYVLQHTVRTTASDVLDYTKYSGDYTPALRGTWRVRAYHPEDASNAATHSGWRSFIVD